MGIIAGLNWRFETRRSVETRFGHFAPRIGCGRQHCRFDKVSATPKAPKGGNSRNSYALATPPRTAPFRRLIEGHIIVTMFLHIGSVIGARPGGAHGVGLRSFGPTFSRVLILLPLFWRIPTWEMVRNLDEGNRFLNLLATSPPPIMKERRKSNNNWFDSDHGQKCCVDVSFVCLLCSDCALPAYDDLNRKALFCFIYLLRPRRKYARRMARCRIII